MDQLWFITAPYELRLSRLMQRNNLTHEQAQLRITSQPAEEKFIKLADRILISDEKLEENLKKAIEEAKHEYRVE